MYLSENFTDDEFNCPCCGKCKMKMDFIIKLQRARDVARTPFRITSGWRCARHNEAVEGSPASSHLKGLAADIAVRSSKERDRILKAVRKAGFRRIGIGKGFIHVDADPGKPQDVTWTCLEESASK